jgi:hypothetical protein
VTIPIRPFRAEDLRQLTSVREWPCVSIALATHRRFPDWRQDPVRFKALLAQAEADLSARPEARETGGLLEPLRRLLDEESVWEYALDGLAVFVSPSFAAAYRVPITVPDGVVVADTFHTKPLFRFLRTNSTYYVLAVSQNVVNLFQGSVYGAEPVELQSLPGDLVQALGGLGELDEHQKGYTSHGGVAGRRFSGQGPGREDRKENLVKFFRALDKGLREFLREEKAPLLLAAVRYYHPIYREANTYPNLLSEGLDGNYERAKGDAIHAEAWPIVSRELERRVSEWTDLFRSLAGKGLAVDGIEAVASATVQGRVRCVLASADGNTPGRLDRATGEVRRSEERKTSPEGADLLDDICEEAWKRGAEIYVLPRPALPTPNPIAAVLRF